MMQPLLLFAIVATVAGTHHFQQSHHLRGRELLGCPSWAPAWLCNKPKNVCPVVTPVADFDVSKYTDKTWYVQKQQVNGYQKVDDLFCVTATYNTGNDGLIKVDNRANQKAVNQNISGEGNAFSKLCAKQLKAGTGEIGVQPCFLFNIGLTSTAGPYWVIAIDPNYEWAVISGGQPTEIIGDDSADVKCTTKTTGINGSGLWLFTRSPMPPNSVVDTMEATLADMGVSTAKLLDVKQAGCTYEGMPIKN